ncbi:hypothetical protein, partial [Brevibacillus panacihumi]
FSTLHLEPLLRRRLLLAAVPPFGMEPASTATSEDPNRPKAFFPFSAAPLQQDDQKTKKRSRLPAFF